MKVYLAARFSSKAEVALRAEELKALDIECTSTWLTEEAPANTTLDKHSDSYLTHTAMVDIRDMRRSDAIVLFTIDPKEMTPRGGRHFESGFAYGSGKPLIICGPRENVFHYLPDVVVCKEFEQVKQHLLKMDYTRKSYMLDPLSEGKTYFGYTNSLNGR